MAIRTLAYQRGFRAGRQGKERFDCPYEGDNDGSFALQLQWMDGHFDAVTGKHKPKVRVRNLRPRKTSRIRWPRSVYARTKVKTYLGMST